MKLIDPKGRHHKSGLNRTRALQQKALSTINIFNALCYLLLAQVSSNAERMWAAGFGWLGPVARPSWQSWICVLSLSCRLCSGWEAVGLQDVFAPWIKKLQPALPCVNTHSRSRLLCDPPACISYQAEYLWIGLLWELFNQFITSGGIYKSWRGRCDTPCHFCLTSCGSKGLQQLSPDWDDWLEVIFYHVTFAIITWHFACLGGNNQYHLQKALWKVALEKTVIWTSYYNCSCYKLRNGGSVLCVWKLLLAAEKTSRARTEKW